MKAATATAASVALLLSGLLSSAHAAPPCTADALNALSVPNVHVASAKAVAASNTDPAYCRVVGTVATHGEGAPDGSARFAMRLPDAWRQRFFFMGVGGNAGRLVPAVNVTDHREALGKGYAVVVTDAGHTGNGTDAAWVIAPDGKRDTAKVADFFYRAAHEVTVAGKQFAQAYYAAPVEHAYFDGCSNGGRMGMMEADRYPTDYDGIIAGDPGMDFNSVMLRFAVQKVALASAAAWLPPETLAAVDAKVTARCDAIDGAKDGLVQNPARCPVRAEDLVCRGTGDTDCLSPAQARVLRAYTTPLRDRHGHLLYPGWAITNLSGPHGMSFWTTGNTAPDLAHREAPWGSNAGAPPLGWKFAREALTYWMGRGPDAKMMAVAVDSRTNTTSDALVAAVHRAFSAGETKDPAKLLPFIREGRKLIIYHGASDPAIPAERSIWFYRALAAKLHGMDEAQASVRLFLVPGMQHCGGGIGPDQFDTLTAMEDWVEHGVAPQAIAANTRPDSAAPHHLPLCPYPQQARFSGNGSVDDAANWKCMAVPREAAGSGHAAGAG